MGDFGNVSELEAELIKRNREIAKVRDDVLKAERRLEEAQMRNDDLLEKAAVLDSEVTTKSKRISELEEKSDALGMKMLAKEAEIEALQKEQERKIEAVRTELQAGSAAREQDLAKHEELKAQISALETEKEKLQEIMDEEKRCHQMTKVTLEQAESSSREASTRLLESRRRLQELEDELKEKEGLSAGQVQQLEEERSHMSLEIQRVTGVLEEHKAVREDLESQARERDRELVSVRSELEDLRRENGDHKSTISELEVARDAAIKEHEDHVNSHDEVIQAERKRHEEHLHRVMQEAASLDGRLSGQRLLLEETRQALDRSEGAEARLSEQLAEKGRELSLEQEAMREALEREAEKASRDLSAKAAHYESELQSEQVCLRRHASSEIDAANRAMSEAEENERRLESRLQALMSDHEEAKSHHGRSLESLRGQHTDLRQRLAEAEERGQGHQQEGDKLRKDLEEAKLEAERTVMAHRQELERVQQTLEAEGQSRSAAERILQSQLEEKDTLLEHRNATIERLEHDLADARRRIDELDAAVSKAREDGEAKVHAMGVRNAQLEGELRSRHERLTEVEGRLEAQRQYLEQVNETLNQAQLDRDTLMHTKGSLEAQLKQELSHKDAVTVSLTQAQEESSRRCKELEERILRDRDSHRDAMEEVKRSVADELKQGSERLQAIEAELLTARQRCEVLMRNKADLQREVEEHREKHTVREATIRDHLSEQERLNLELDQHRSARSTLEEEFAQLKKEKLDCDAKIKELTEQVASVEEQQISQREDFGGKVQRLDELLNKEREQREAAERSLGVLRKDSEQNVLRLEQERRRSEQELQSSVDTWKSKAEELEHQIGQGREQLEAHRTRFDELDNQKREAEATLRNEAASAKLSIQRLEAEAQRKETALEEAKATLAQQQASASARITSLERQLESETAHVKKLQAAKEAAEKDSQGRAQGSAQMMERLGMAAEELFTRQIEFALDKQRLSGALEESRRTLRNSLGVPNPVAAVDSVRISGLEQQLSEERRKSIEQMVALQRAERKCHQLEESHKRSEEQRLDAVQQSREAERRCVVLTEDLRKANIKQNALDVRCDETRERAAMSAAEIGTIRYESKYESAKLRGALDELRYMLKMQEGSPTNRGYPIRRGSGS
uniref:Uncharacterized protein n=1 Tax=Alexandrium monilatum TaxID=311494 RepID=A0A7S4R5X6_9DINO